MFYIRKNYPNFLKKYDLIFSLIIAYVFNVKLFSIVFITRVFETIKKLKKKCTRDLYWFNIIFIIILKILVV